MNFLRLSWAPRGEIIGNFPVDRWPPPEELFLISTSQFGEITHLGLTTADKLATLPAGEGFEDYLVTPLTQVSISGWGDELADHPHLARGAEYVIEVQP